MNAFAKILSVAACAAAVAAVATTADAKPRKRHVHKAAGYDVIVVRPRAFTDPGVVVPVGSEARYMVEMTINNRMPYERYQPGLLWRPDPGYFYPFY
jgi:hypothetical protein